MVFKTPPFLKSGDCIGIAATARWVTNEQLQTAIDRFTSWGLRVKVAPNVHTLHFQLAGNAEQRADGLQSLLDDEEVKAVIIARGGYGTVHTIDLLDFSRFESNPKWIAGYSDITVLHAHLNSRGIATIHSTMPISFPDATEEAIENLRKALFGELVSFKSTGEDLFQPVSGVVMGGNLSVLYSLLGSDSWREIPDVILFIEDVDEMLYHLDRMLWGLYRSGILSNVKAIICGGFTQMKDNTKAFGFPSDNPWGADEYTIIRSIAEKLQVPVAFGFPAGHLSDNRAFYLGRRATLNCEGGYPDLRYQHP
jgi:muramoyltetrapeptide carboxypeptidase